MRDSTVFKAVGASLIVLGMQIPSGHAQAVFFGMMSEQTPTVYHSHPYEISEQKAKEMFEAMDINQDGRVTKDEFSAGYGEYFPEDGGSKAAERSFKALDVRNAGKVTEQEFVANRTVAFGEGDTAALAPNGTRDDDGK